MAKLLIIAAIFFAALPLYAEGERSVVVFASEKIMGDWIQSYFTSLGANASANLNECEMSVGAKFMESGFVLREIVPNETLKFKAREMHTAFSRYSDLSGMPNDMLAAAAQVADKDAKYLIACGAIASKSRIRSNRVCADVGCKAIDTVSRRRVDTAANEKCAANGDGRVMSIAMIKEACTQAGIDLARRLR